MLISTHGQRLLSSSISILIVMPNVIQRGLFPFSAHSALKPYFNLDRHAKRYSMMLVSILLCSLLSSNITILIVMPNVIQ
jgi:hypothetical protein